MLDAFAEDGRPHLQLSSLELTPTRSAAEVDSSRRDGRGRCPGSWLAPMSDAQMPGCSARRCGEVRPQIDNPITSILEVETNTVEPARHHATMCPSYAALTNSRRVEVNLVDPTERLLQALPARTEYRV